MKTRLPALLAIAFVLAGSVSGQTPDQIRRAFADIRSDRIPHNCERATLWLLQHAGTLQPQLLEELYKTDKQGKDAILHVLFNTPSFTPDDRFRRLVIARLPEQNRYVTNHTIFNSGDIETDRIAEDGAHWEAWKYINDHFDSFEPLLQAQVAATENEWVVWATAWLLKHRGILEEHRDWFTDAVLARAAANLKDDRKNYNASQAVRLFFLLGEQSIPILQETSKSSDPQARDLARATLDAFEGKHDAIGFLTARVGLDEVLFGEQPESPDWVQDALEPYYENKKPYQGQQN
ncbi:MAG: hypothetical protein M3R10_03620 [Verrucomicrobiota bacterium]|nr:hypothetical protein [Verrucomicrobiota bacterium]